MIALTFDEVRALVGGAFEPTEGATEITGVQIDSRRVEPGDLFVAVGRGAAFVDDARARGAAATLLPDDAHADLAELGRAVRDRSTARVVGITGSTGKTSTKDILHAICRPHARTVANERSYNAELGVPLTLCRLEPDTEVCIVELAMRGLGQIAALCEIARPDIGLITNVGPAHLELVGSLDAVVCAKSELLDSLPSEAAAILPADFPVIRHDLALTRFGEPDARVEEDGTVVRFDGRAIRFDFSARHQARNALAALHAARALGIEADDEVEVELSAWRGDEVPLAEGGLVIVDCWNANPLSMRAALEHLAERAAGRRTVAILGEMAELGSEAARYHEEIGALVSQLPIDVLVGVGPLARRYLADGVPIAVWATDATAAIRMSRRLIEPTDCVLVKGSRAVGLEVVAEALTAVPVR